LKYFIATKAGRPSPSDDETPLIADDGRKKQAPGIAIHPAGLNKYFANTS